jgi:hypothetical protein
MFGMEQRVVRKEVLTIILWEIHLFQVTRNTLPRQVKRIRALAVMDFVR